MAFAKSQDQVDLVATVLSAMEDAPTTVRTAPLVVISHVAEPRALVGVFVGGQRFALDADDVQLAARILLGAQPFAGCNAVADALLTRLGMAELQRFRANVVRMCSPMGRG